MVTLLYTASDESKGAFRGAAVLFVTLLIASSIARAVVVFRTAKLTTPSVPESLRTALTWTSLANLAVFSSFVSAVVLLTQVSPTSLVMLGSIGTIAGAAHVFAPSKKLLSTSVPLLAGLPALAAVVNGRPLLGFFFVVMGLLSYGFGRRIHQDYMAFALTRVKLTQRGDDLLRSQKLLEEVIEKSPVAIGLLRDETVLFVNDTWAGALGRKKSDIVGRALSELVHPDDLQAVRHHLATDGLLEELSEVRLVRADGSHVFWEIMPSQRVRDRLSLLPGMPSKAEDETVLMVARDVTERNRLRAQLLVSDRLASLGTLAAGVAHEINNPLTYALANLERLAATADPQGGNDSSRALAQEALEGAQRIRSIVTDMTSFTREDDRAQAADVNLAVTRALKMTANEIRHVAQTKTRLGVVPLAHADAGKLGQVLLNLLLNAAYAMREGNGKEHTLTVTTEANDAGVTILIRDTGTGIAREDLKRIFDPFFTTKPIGEGTGLGLFVCHEVIRGFGGKIAVESDVGHGTVFRLTLPRASAGGVANEGAAQKVALQEVSPAQTDGSAKARVLVLDDEPTVGRIVERLLRADYDVTVQTSGAEALKLLSEAPRFDVILCDLMMPDMTGMAFYDAAQAVVPSTPFVFMSGGAFTTQAEAFVAQRKDECLEKPLDFDRLRSAIRSRIASRAHAS
jgi:PAS domain S-box-containing protein